ncbi:MULTISPECIES: extracellular solute-binding protein [unclassified Streptomyces]|uniref:extracellular solute-binding protein n=1 Tax=Streptomyces TaxID=1883 RepID=UPI0001C18F2B|nr:MULTISPECIES: extracellular solute-binding protein [unclassified Streptomyces]MYR67773.1 extracellular solute-binding protein [Streptomyces sp. SID4939]MYR99387.1 extracellular solute-binding protein [Streptomyces sp. SID4940]MYT67885.1 extracellular solute-binding protein [Streptomyces sp. SID8357]MYT86728.1 extracellular solute-binding protein [Streptomyces sp. SID8360]MYU35810.1 extracellular solute-binding protein [Streptomyces sp. SID8358]MYW41445.1 extracellular solute-binding protei
MKNRILAGAVVLVSSLALSGCGYLPGLGGDGRTVTVWLMKGSVSQDFLDRFTKSYEEEHPSVELEFVIQEWGGIGPKVMKVLDGNDAPDVIEVGNTQVAQYAQSGALRDLTLESMRDLGGEDWLPGLAQPGSVNGGQYGIPWYAANRVVIYNKDLFEQAGITETPRTRKEWLEISEKLNTSGRQGIYLAGQNWYVLSGFIWDEGGELADDNGGDWQGALDTPAALKGMEFYKQLQQHGDGPKDADEETPPQTDVFAKGDVAQIITTPGEAAAIEQKNPELKGKLGFFPIPGKRADKPGAVFTGGSDLIVPEKSKERGEGIEVVKALAGEKWQKELARTMSYVPNKPSLAHVIDGQEGTAAMAEGAAQGRATPNSPHWAAVEAVNPIKPYMTAVLMGGDPAEEAKEASERITSTLITG